MKICMFEELSSEAQDHAVSIFISDHHDRFEEELTRESARKLIVKERLEFTEHGDFWID